MPRVPTGTRLNEVVALLENQSMADPAEADKRLAAVEALLGDIVAGDALESSAAARLLALRVELSGHLSAASTLRALDLDGRANVLLHRAATAVRLGLSDLDATAGSTASADAG